MAIQSILEKRIAEVDIQIAQFERAQRDDPQTNFDTEFSRYTKSENELSRLEAGLTERRKTSALASKEFSGELSAADAANEYDATKTPPSQVGFNLDSACRRGRCDLDKGLV